jgi:hypothetical protein
VSRRARLLPEDPSPEWEEDNRLVAILVYIDRSTIQPARADELEVAARRLVEHVDAGERRLVSYGIYFSSDRSTMTVVHVHPDSASLEQLLGSIAPVLAPFRELLHLQSIDVYGSPSDGVMALLESKTRLLGGVVTVHPRVAGVEAAILG